MFVTTSLFLVTGATQLYAAAVPSGTYVAQFSPSFPNIPAVTGVVSSYNPGPYDTSSILSTTPLSGFPPTWSTPPTNSAEVQAVYNAINWDQVPKAPVRKFNTDGSWDFASESSSNPYCWWTYDTCVKPKVSYLPPDIYTCPNNGDWGLTYDDGPFNRYTDSNADKENPYAEPALYNFLVNTNQKSTLFYVGSNVVNYPAAAKRGLNDGHHLCVHSYSHQPMTSLSNEKVVSELYWSAKAIKAATGVTPKCWRPPQGDVDDRVRAIAWQMGMTTILWDHDTNDWGMPGPNGGNLSPAVVDSYFQTWIDNYSSGKDRAGHIVLEHELNSMTVNKSMFWMPRIQKVFNVIPALACNGISQPYWEQQFEYPLSNSRPTNTGGTTTSVLTTKTSTTSTKATTTTTKKTATTITKTTTTKSTTTKTTSTRTTTSKTATSSSNSKCITGSSGKRNGDGNTGYCCTSSDDCLETCRSGVCGL